MNEPTKDVAIGLGTVAVALLLFTVLIPLGVDMPDTVKSRALLPNFWPDIIAVALGLAGAVLVVQGWAGRKRLAGLGLPPDASLDASDDHYELALTRGQTIGRLCVTLILIFGLYFAIEYLGIPVASALVLALLMRYAGEKSWVVTLSVALLMPAVLYVFFVHVASVPIPMGLFE